MSTLGNYFSLPARTIGIWPVGNATAWAYGSWYQLIDKLDSGIFVSGIQFQVGAILATLDTTREILFEIGVGLAGSEVVKMQIPYSIRLDTAVGYYNSSGYNSIRFPEPMLIPAGSRIAVRVADSFAVAVTYDGFKLMYREVVDPTVALDSPSNLAVITDRTPEEIFTGNSVDGFDLEYKIQINQENDFSTDLSPLSQSTLNWYGVDIDSSNQNVYAAVAGGDIYKQTAGNGNFVALGQTTRTWYALAIDSSNHDVYASVPGTDIYKQTGGVGSFVALGQSAAASVGLAVDSSNHNVYSAVVSVDIYKRTGGVGSFVALGAGALAWADVAVDSVNHDVYAVVSGGDIYKQTAGTGSFVALNQVIRSWVGVSIDGSNHNVYAIVNVGDLYIQYGGSGDFVPQGQPVKGWSSVSVDSTTHNVYAVHYFLDIYKQTNPTPLLEKVSVSDAGFTDITNSSNSHPFPTGEQIKHTVQSADILGPGVYFWRVSARDPLGTNFYRSWTSPQSFTLLTGPKTWNGAIWDYKPLKVWDGTAWVVKPVKVWNGTSWIIKG
ncbi:hypothetical protein CVV43_00440 [Candidatus Saccharibacteria bacterium HGW-Saccharibacteria-1]|jgi:hypothetical protein|nr:MAG: hypothetical protein CVV43_00440 [Candidatus Saccharibacteria bacterium HGW-Saccharibacteria-1]